MSSLYQAQNLLITQAGFQTDDSHSKSDGFTTQGHKSERGENISASVNLSRNPVCTCLFADSPARSPGVRQLRSRRSPPHHGCGMVFPTQLLMETPDQLSWLTSFHAVVFCLIWLHEGPV